MVEALRCSHCSAPVQDDRWTTCPFCGSVLAKATIDPLRAVIAPERFAAAARSPALPALMRHQPSVAGPLAMMGFQTAFLLFWTIVTGVMAAFMFSHAGPLGLVPGVMCFFGIVMLVRSSRRTADLATASLQRRIMVWRDERIEVSGGGRNSSASTEHYVLLEDGEGRRSEHGCSDRLAGAHAPGDIGVAYLRGDVLLDFQRLDV